MTKPDESTIKAARYIASVSWGKDSLAMLLMLIEREQPLDEVVFYDTGMEFQAIYDTRDKTLPLLATHGIRYTELHPLNSMEHDMFDRDVDGPYGPHKGYDWCGGRCRWGTAMKQAALDKHRGDAIAYIGIAHDERERLAKETASNKRYPLAEYGITEGEALLYCYERGYRWMEDGKPLYALLDRVSCWCCRNKNLKELRNYYNYLPGYWDRLKSLQDRTNRPFKGPGKSIYDLERRFAKEYMHG